jgi:hypothetical protein
VELALCVVCSSALAGFETPQAVPLTSDVEFEVANLRQAYVFLEAGNHDYKGHRVRALRAVGAACIVLGFNAKGDGRNREVQSFSNNLLASARDRLALVEPHAQASHQEQVVGLIHQAMQEIDQALQAPTTDTPTGGKKRHRRR